MEAEELPGDPQIARKLSAATPFVNLADPSGISPNEYRKKLHVPFILGEVTTVALATELNKI